MRILWHSVKPNIPSGYGVQTNLFIRALSERGIDVDVSCAAGLWGAVEKIVHKGKEIRIFPHSAHGAKYGQDMVKEHFKNSGADIVFSFQDVFVFDVNVVKSLPWYAWTPIDSTPVMSHNRPVLDVCKGILVPTQWGRQVLIQSGYLQAVYLPCAYSKEQYFLMDKSEAIAKVSKLFNIDLSEKKLFNVVSCNSGTRKNLSVLFEAWAEVQKLSDVYLYIHTDPSGYFNSGVDLFEVMKLYKIDESRILFPPPWHYACGALGSDFLNLIYNASVAHINVCAGEGFGVPIVEAQAAGCPVIAPAFGGAGEVVKCGAFLNGILINSVPGALQILPRFQDLVEGIQLILSFQESREYIAEGVKQYEINEVVDNYFMPWLRGLEDVHGVVK